MSLRKVGIEIDGNIMKEPLVEEYGYFISSDLFKEFRNGWNAILGDKVGESYVDKTYQNEPGSDVPFICKDINFSIGFDTFGIIGFSISSDLNYSYNWIVDHLGYQLKSRCSFFYSPIKYFSLKNSMSITGFWEEGTTLSELFSKKD